MAHSHIASFNERLRDECLNVHQFLTPNEFIQIRQESANAKTAIS